MENEEAVTGQQIKSQDISHPLRPEHSSPIVAALLAVRPEVFGKVLWPHPFLSDFPIASLSRASIVECEPVSSRGDRANLSDSREMNAKD
jgi:hypothetical protein